MRTALPLALFALLAACNAQAPAGGGAAAGGGDTTGRFDLPEGVTRADLYTRTPDPTAGPCYYYRVEGFEVLAGCAG